MFNKDTVPFWIMLILSIFIVVYMQFIMPSNATNLIISDIGVVDVVINIYGIDKFRTKK